MQHYTITLLQKTVGAIITGDPEYVDKLLRDRFNREAAIIEKVDNDYSIENNG